jgi:hypothetical protein
MAVGGVGIDRAGGRLYIPRKIFKFFAEGRMFSMLYSLAVTAVKMNSIAMCMHDGSPPRVIGV